MVAFYNREHQGWRAIRWTRLSCRSFAANAVRLSHALAYNLGNFLHTGDAGADQELVDDDSRLIKIEPREIHFHGAGVPCLVSKSE